VGFVDIAAQLGSGMLRSFGIFILTLMFSLPLGLVVCFGRMSKFTPLRWLTTAYISIMRGTPLMLQLLVVFFSPYYVFGLTLTPSYRFYSVIIAFSINYGAYFSEIYRGGIQSMSVGQYEAAKVLGYSSSQTFFRIILPQVIKRILPSVTNEVMTLVKDTALAYSVSYLEMFNMTRNLAASQRNVLPFFVAGVVYYIFNAFLAWIMDRAEQRLRYYD
jgi:polar amino acid transport system permease protein